jgi:hypothetical protein
MLFWWTLTNSYFLNINSYTKDKSSKIIRGGSNTQVAKIRNLRESPTDVRKFGVLKIYTTLVFAFLGAGATPGFTGLQKYSAWKQRFTKRAKIQRQKLDFAHI